MSKEKSTKASKANKGARTTARALRTATFRPEATKAGKVFRPVNKRAQKWARTLGKRTRITPADIIAIQATGKVKIAVYLKDNSLKVVA